MSTEQNGTPDGETSAANDAETGRETLERAEQRLEALAEEIAVVIGACAAEEREALHDYAVSLVRERLPVAEDNERYSASRAQRASDADGAGGTRVSAGYGLLLLPVGFVILPVLPPVGVTVMLIGIGLVVVGIVTALFARVGGTQQT